MHPAPLRQGFEASLAAIVVISVIILLSPIFGYGLVVAKLSRRTKLVLGGIGIAMLIALPLLLTVFPNLGTGS